MTKLTIFNDTKQTLLLRINRNNTLPTQSYIPTLHHRVVEIDTEEVFLKLWNDNVLLIQEKKEAKQK